MICECKNCIQPQSEKKDRYANCCGRCQPKDHDCTCHDTPQPAEAKCGVCTQLGDKCYCNTMHKPPIDEVDNFRVRDYKYLREFYLEHSECARKSARGEGK